jgi:hypothetical protein
MPTQRTPSSAILYFGMAALISLLAGCGSSESTFRTGTKPTPTEIVAAERAAHISHINALAAAHAAHADMLHTLHACSEHMLVRAANAVQLEKCTQAIEVLEHDFEAHHLTEAEARTDLDRIDWMHPSDPSKHEGNQAFSVAQADFKLAFSYTEAPPFPHEPSCIDWAKAGEYGDVAYIARAGWPYAYLPQGLRAVSYTCERVAAEGAASNVRLSFLVCTSALQNAMGSGILTESQRLKVEHGIKCGENIPETKAEKEQEARQQAKEEREQAAIEKPAEEQNKRAYEEGERASGG